MTQTNLSDHIDKGMAKELCPQCLKPITPYWRNILIEPYEDCENKALLTNERTCKHCGFTEREEVETLKTLACEHGCDNCVAKCRGGC